MNPHLWRLQSRFRKLFCRHIWKASPFRALIVIVFTMRTSRLTRQTITRRTPAATGLQTRRRP